MLFNSFGFTLLYLPIVIIFYFIFNHVNLKLGKIFLLISSVVFYAFAGWKYLLILLISLAINYCFLLLLHKDSLDAINKRKIVLVIGISFNILVLLYFKYYNFFIKNINSIFSSNISLKKLIVPLGISFITFQQIMYLVETYRKSINSKNFTDYALFISFFPKLVMGPLADPNSLINQFNDTNNKTVNYDNIANGIRIFIIGLVKKVLIADMVAKVVNMGFLDAANCNMLDVWLIVISYTMQIYFDFSGYSDMAIGIARMLNIELPINFSSPYKSTSIKEFWNRWHITLNQFFIKDVYIPLGGSRKGTAITYLNIMIIFLISGFWHGANWTFILWGICHGVLCCMDRMFKNIHDKLPKFIQWAITFLLVNILWLLFRAEDIQQFFVLFTRMFNFSTMGLPSGKFLQPFRNIYIFSLFYLTTLFIALIPKNIYKKKFNNKIITTLLYAGVFVLCLFTFATNTEFVYFNF